MRKSIEARGIANERRENERERSSARMSAKTFTPGTFAVELGDRRYGQIHKAGCRDLEDATPELEALIDWSNN